MPQLQLNIFQIGQEGIGLTDDEKQAIKACYAGEATDGQQRVAIDTIIDKLCLADMLSYQAGSFDETAFMAGRAFPGKQIRSVIKQKTGETQ